MTNVLAANKVVRRLHKAAIDQMDTQAATWKQEIREQIERSPVAAIGTRWRIPQDVTEVIQAGYQKYVDGRIVVEVGGALVIETGGEVVIG